MGRRWKKRKHQHLPAPQQNPPQPRSPVEEFLDRTSKSFAVRAEYQAGPLPSPDVLARYNEVLPGLAERLVQMVESQSRHRQELEKAVVNGNIQSEAPGQRYGLIVGLVIGLGALAVVALGHEPAGVSVIIAELAAFAGAFIYGKRRQQKELEEKRSPRNS